MPAMTEAAQIGKRQELRDDIVNIESEATPFLSMLKKGDQPNQMLCSWPAESLPNVASTGVLDNTPVTTFNRVNRYLLQGVCQHFRQPWAVSTLANLTNAAGVGRNEKGRQRKLAMLLTKRQMEQQFLSDSDATVESGATPFTARGLFSWLANAEQSQLAVPSAMRPASATRYTGALTSFTPDAFRTIMQAAYTAKKSPLKLDGFVGRSLKAVIDDFTRVHPVSSSTSQPQTIYRVEGNSEFMNVVDQLGFSFGKIRTHLSEFMLRTVDSGEESASTPNAGAFIDISQWDIAYLAAMANTDLPPDGSGVRGFIDAIAILRCLNPLGQPTVIAT